jgi:hypothetical protein
MPCRTATVAVKFAVRIAELSIYSIVKVPIYPFATEQGHVVSKIPGRQYGRRYPLLPVVGVTEATGPALSLELSPNTAAPILVM